MTTETPTKPDDKALVDTSGPKLGIFDDISNDDYHRSKGISKSGLDLIAQSPAHYITNKRHPKPQTPALGVGQAFHCLVMEPEKFDDGFVLAPKLPPNHPTEKQLQKRLDGEKETEAATRSIDFWAQWDAENEGKVVLTGYKAGNDPFWKPGEWDTVHRMAEAVRAHATAGILLDPEQGKAEQSAYWIDKETGKLCRCRTDFINEAHNHLVVDLKSTLDASFHGFMRSVAEFRYFVQDAFYMDGLRAAGMTPNSFVFVAVEKLPPYGVGVYTLDREAKYAGIMQYRSNLDLYARCHKEDVWPAYPTDVRELNLTTWQVAGKVR